MRLKSFKDIPEYCRTHKYELVQECYFYLLYVCLCSAALGVFRLLASYFDSDTYFIIATGRNIIENRILPQINPFTIHENLPMIVHQWGFDVIIAGLYDWLGDIGLKAFCLVLFTGMLASMYVFCRQYTKSKKTALAVSTLPACFLACWGVLRPSCITIPLILLLLSNACRFKTSKKPLHLLYTAIISLLIVNIHTSLWFIGVVLLLPWLVPEKIQFVTFKEFIKTYISEKKWLIANYITYFVVGFANPYGITGMLYPLISYGEVNNNSISELQATTFTSVAGIIALTGAIVLALHVVKHRLQGINWSLVCLCGGTFILGVMHLRNIWMTYVGLVPLLIEVLTDVSKKMHSGIKTTEISKEASALTVKGFTFLIVVVMAIGSSYIISPAVTEDATVEEPVEIVEYLDTQDCTDADIFAGFNCGAYLQFHGYKTYIDARPEIYSKKLNKTKDIYKEYCEIVSGEGDVGEWLEQYDFDYLVVYETVLNIYLSQSENYELVMTDGDFSLYVPCS